MKILRWIWEFPQCILGYILTKIYNVKYVTSVQDVCYYTGKFPGGISLGLFVILKEEMYKKNQNNCIEHEFGHTIQSKILGPLYLIIIGIPSILWNAFYIIDKTRPYKNYFDFYTERWADKLMNIRR